MTWKLVDADNLLSEWRYVSVEGQGHFLILDKSHLHMKIKTGFSQKLLRHFFFFFFFLFSLTSLSRLFHSYRDEPIRRWGEKREYPGKNHLTHPQVELDLSHLWPVWSSNPHQSQRWDDRMVKGDNEISHLNHSATGAACAILNQILYVSFHEHGNEILLNITQTRPWNILQYFTAVKMVIFRWKKVIFFLFLITI